MKFFFEKPFGLFLFFVARHCTGGSIVASHTATAETLLNCSEAESQRFINFYAFYFISPIKYRFVTYVILRQLTGLDICLIKFIY